MTRRPALSLASVVSRAALAALVCVTTLAALVPVEAWGWDLRVGTRTRLTSTLKAQGTRVSVDGYLRDNVGQGVAGMPISIDFVRRRGSSGPIRRDTVTDRTGRYYLAVTLPSGEYDGSVRFSGQQYYYDASTVDLGTLRTERGEVDLSFRAPPVARRDTGAVQVIVGAVSEAEPVEGLKLRVGIGPTTLDVTTGASGTATFPVDLSEVRQPTVTLWARLVDERDFNPARVETRIRVLVDPRLGLEASPVRARLQRGLLLEGELSDRAGPVEGQPVTLQLEGDGQELGRFTVQTDDDGHYEMFLAEDQLLEGELTARAIAELPRGDGVSATPVMVGFVKTGSGSLLWFIAGVLGVSLGLVAGFSLRDRLKRRKVDKAARPRRTSASEARRPAIVGMSLDNRPADAPSGRDGIAGVLYDGQTGEPLRGGEVWVAEDMGHSLDLTKAPAEQATERVHTDADGYFSFGPLERGNWVLVGRKRGYVAASHAFRIPHRGKLAWFRFTLTPVRVVVRDIYADLVDELSRGRQPWGRLTPRQVYRVILAAVRQVAASEELPTFDEGYAAFTTSLSRLLSATRGERTPLSGRELAETFTHIIEEVYFSQRLHDEEIIAISEKLAAAIRTFYRDAGSRAFFEVFEDGEDDEQEWR